jgi:hypothetical protein
MKIHLKLGNGPRKTIEATKAFAYVLQDKHIFQPWMRKKGSWRVDCSCGRMLEKSGSLEQVTEDWRQHVIFEGERRERAPIWYSYPD